MNKPDHPPLRARSSCCSRCSSRYTSWWTRLRRRGAQRQRRTTAAQLIEEAQIKRGRIRAADGTVLARSVQAPTPARSRALLPAGRPASRTRSATRSSLPAPRASSASTTTTSPGERGRVRVDRRRSSRARSAEGDDLRTHLDPDAQRVAIDAARRAGRGAVVAIEPQTGDVRVMASVPGYDTNDIGTAHGRLKLETAATRRCSTARRGPLPAGLDVQGRHRRRRDRLRQVHARRPRSTAPTADVRRRAAEQLRRRGLRDRRPHARRSTNSVNTVFAQVGDGRSARRR